MSASSTKSTTSKPKRNSIFSRRPRYITNGEEARRYRVEEDRAHMRDQTAFNAGRMGIPG